jgi:hypothetical protein
MRKIAMVFAVATSIMSFQVSALEVLTAGFISDALTRATVSTRDTSVNECVSMACKASIQIVEDSQLYYSTGKMTEFLVSEVKELKIGAGNISDDEAVDVLVDFAHRTLELFKF